MSTYLVAFIVSNLKPLSVYNNSLIKIWAREEFLPYTRYASEIAPQILEYFEKYFGIPYPLPKMDIVAVPEFGFSAMENWGLITFRYTLCRFKHKNQENFKSVTEFEKNLRFIFCVSEKAVYFSILTPRPMKT